MALRTLIINADDLGYTYGINRTVELCAERGVLRSATLMAGGDAFEDAVATVARSGCISVGVHLVLTELKSVAPPEELSGLVDGAGFLPATPGALLVSLLRGRQDVKDAIRRELDGQVAKVLDYGIKPTHLDSHKHVHILPEVLEAVIAVAKKYSIRWIRNPFDCTPFSPLLPTVRRNERPTFCKQHLKARAALVFRANFLRRIRLHGLRTPDTFFGVALTGVWTERAMLSLLEHTPKGVSEWMVHPGVYDEELKGKSTRLREQRERERDLLLSPLWQDWSMKYGIHLCDYREEFA